jgi:nucleotide-binding universal stress UspA family protein
MTAVMTAMPDLAPGPVEQAAGTVEPVIAAVNTSPSSRAAAEAAVALAAELDAPVVFVYVRRGPAVFLGAPVYQRRLTREMRSARRALRSALLVAEAAGVEADAEILEGSPRQRILEFARDRGAQLVVVGSRRPRLRRSVAQAIVRDADRPVVIAARGSAREVLPRAA